MKTTKTTKTNFKKFLVLIPGICLFIGAVAYLNKDLIPGFVAPMKEKSGIEKDLISNNNPTHNNEVVTRIGEEAPAPVPLLSGLPTEESEARENLQDATLLPLTNDNKNFEAALFRGLAGEELSERRELQLTANYRAYLSMATCIIVNFLQDKPYINQLDDLKKIITLKEIVPILTQLEEYNQNYLGNVNPQREKIFPVNSSLIEKFIKIEKKSAGENDKKELRDKIIKNLDNFTNFLYSEELERTFIKASK